VLICCLLGYSVNRRRELGYSVPDILEPNRNRFFRFRFFQFRFPVLSVRFSVLGFLCPGLSWAVTWFSKGSPGTSVCAWRHIGRFLEYDRGRSHQKRNTSRNPIIQVFHSWMSKRILGRMRETKVTNTEVNWLYSALIARFQSTPLN
jgi:hypothetical protein